MGINSAFKGLIYQQNAHTIKYMY